MNQFAVIVDRSEYRLAMLVGEALAVLACVPHSAKLQNDACIVSGYAEAFRFYPQGQFPWDYLAARIDRMKSHAWSVIRSRHREREPSPNLPKYEEAERLWRAGQLEGVTQREVCEKVGIAFASFTSWIWRKQRAHAARLRDERINAVAA